MGDAGVTVEGFPAYYYTGQSVNTAGDVNGDGKDDFLIGSYTGDAATDSTKSGITYLVFGASRSELGLTVEPADLDGTNGFRLNV